MKKKRGQHYVWSYYLTSWSNESEQVYCLRNNTVFEANPKKIAKARDFYRVRNLSAEEILILEKGFIKEDWHEDIKQINREWIELFTKLFRVKEQLERVGEWNEKKEYDMDVMLNNLVEDFHSEIEKANITRLDSLKNKDMNFLQSEEERFDFIFFLCLQYVRTNMMKNNVLRSFAAGPVSIPPKQIENIWSILYFILATNLALNLSSNSGYCVKILRNDSSVPFITGDQPVVNTHANYSIYDEETKELELYYPINPMMALLITSLNCEDKPAIVDIEDNKVIMYNTLIYNASEEQIYSNDLTTFKELIKVKN